MEFGILSEFRRWVLLVFVGFFVGKWENSMLCFEEREVCGFVWWGRGERKLKREFGDGGERKKDDGFKEVMMEEREWKKEKKEEEGAEEF